MTGLGQLYDKDGCVTVDLGLAARLRKIRTRFIDIFSIVSEAQGLSPVQDAQGVINLYQYHESAWALAWSSLHRLPEVHALIGEPRILNLLRELGVVVPALSFPVFVRADMTSDSNRQGTHLHQDYPYNLGSNNSVTVWIPLQDTIPELGSLRIARGSHKQGVIPNDAGVISSFPEEQLEPTTVKLGQVMAFSQFLVHKSGYNQVGDIRFSILCRYTYLADTEYINRGYPYNFDFHGTKIT
jgi:hypothetical protein